MNKKYVYTSFFILILIAVSLVFLKVISPFVMDIFLALLFTHFFFPLKKLFNNKVNSRIAGALTIFTIIFIVVIPVGSIMVMVSSEISQLYMLFLEKWPEVQDNIAKKSQLDFISQIPIIGPEISKETVIDFLKSIAQSVTGLATYSLSFLKSILLNLSNLLLHFMFTLLLTYYMLVDHDRIMDFVNHIIPLHQDNLDEMYSEIEKTGNATIKGTFLIGLIEGTFGAILLTIVGVQSSMLWGVAMFFLSMIPLIGITVVLIPFAIYFLLTGSIGYGIMILIVGISGVTFTQNILKPKFVGDESGLHQGIVLISSIGGISTFGLIGFLIGPMVATLFFVIWKQFALKYGE